VTYVNSKEKSENNLQIPLFLSSDPRSDNVAPEFPKFSDLIRAYIGNYFLLLSLENTPNNSNKEKTEGIAKLFLPYERGYGEKIKRIAKKHGIEVIFTRGQTLKQKLSTPRGKKLKKQGVVYSVRCKSKRCKMEYIGETGRQLKIRMKEQKRTPK